jgi:hypothetical protein
MDKQSSTGPTTGMQQDLEDNVRSVLRVLGTLFNNLSEDKNLTQITLNYSDGSTKIIVVTGGMPTIGCSSATPMT